MATVEKKAGLLQGVVILATWRNLEKSATSGLTEDNEIDQGLAAVRKYNQAHPDAPLAVKLRVWGGSFAPNWVIDSTGGPIHLVHTNVNKLDRERTVGHVWSPGYRKAWAHLQELLAAKYDREPLIREVAATSCAMFTAEPFYLDTHERALTPLRDAGLTDAKYQACLDGIPEDYAPWKTTRFETPLNPFRSTDGAKPKDDPSFTVAWIERCRKADPLRCVLDNHDLGTKDDSSKGMGEVYEAMKKSGSEVEFQTFRETPTDLEGVLQNGIDNGATSIELWQDYGGFTQMPDATLKKYAKLLEANRPR
jgi:hypothetical protein